MANYCRYSSTDVSRAYLGPTYADIRSRTAYNADGTGIFAASAAQRFNATFYNRASTWAREFDSLLYHWAYEAGASHISWIGHVGVYGHCESSKASMHHTGRAFDLARVQTGAGWFVDANWSWRQGIMHKRRYLATALYLRRYFKTVLTAWYDTNHRDHIHFDNGSTLGPISPSSKADTVIIQAACNLMNGENLTINGTWTPSVMDPAFSRLRSKMGLTCLNIRGNLDHTKIFLGVLAYQAANNRAAYADEFGTCS